MLENARILVVDDEPNICLFLKRVLTRDGYDVVAVESGEAALELITQEEFDLALLDLKLKGVGGMEVLTALSQHAPDTAVIVLTGYASLDTAVEALRQGAHDYLFKPAKTVKLRESVRTGLLKRERELRRRVLLQQLEDNLSNSLDEIRAAVTSPPSPTPPSEATNNGRFLKWNEMIVDLMRHVIMVDDILLELSPTEFDLLAYLINEAPRVISPEELVHEVQGYECEPWEASDTIRYHIYRIRRKVNEATGKKDVIKTVRGVGYTVYEEEIQ